MLSAEFSFTVSYADVDRMGYLYYGNYARYLEQARVAVFKSLGISYGEIEDRGIWMPVSEMHIQYRQPIFYDEEIKIKVYVKEYPGVRMTFHYELFTAEGKLCATAETILFFFDPQKKKPIKIPEFLSTLIDPYFH